MDYRFGGSNRGRFSLRDRMFFVGGTAIALCAVCLLSVVLYTRNEADAHVKVVNDQRIKEPTIGNVVLMAPVRDIAEGAKISSAILKEMYWPRNEVPQGAIRRNVEIDGLYAKVTLRANEPILQSDLSPVPLLGGLADLIPEGHRAATIEVDATSGVEGWARPGVHVDVLVTYRDSQDNKTKTQIAIEDAVVLSYNGMIRRPGVTESVGRITSTATVTLAVPVIDAVKLHTARAIGKISLVLRHTGDVRSVGAPEVTSDDFKRSKDGAVRTGSIDGAPRGFVRFQDTEGITRELELRKRRWFEVGDYGS